MSCYLCGSKKNIEVHHLDCNHSNNEPHNRIPLCRSCHVAVHKYYGKSDISEMRKIKKVGTMKYLR
jgi:5-methylcytosine-specific restriction endonuclease McrA